MSQTHITDLPSEMIQNLASNLDVDDIANVRKSSSYIDYCLSGDYFWKTFARTHIPATFPPYMPDISKFDWETNVTKYLRARKYWDMDMGTSKVKIKMKYLPDLRYSNVSAILITKDGKYCITSDQNKTLLLWNLRTLFNNSCTPPERCNTTSHAGWISNLHQNDAYIYSASFDKKVKVWDLDTNLKLVKIMNLKVPVLSVTTLDTNTVCMGLENGVLAFADSRVSETYEQMRIHNRAVVSIVARDNTTISCSEDYNISIVDRRRPRPILRQVPYLPSFSPPSKLSLCDYYLLVASTTGDVHFFDADSFAHKGQHKVTNGNKITGICHNMDSIIVATELGYTKHYTLTNPPKLKRCAIVGGYPCCLHYCKQIIAVGTSRAGAVLMTHADNKLIENN